MDDYSHSQHCINLIEHYEGLRLNAYRDPVGKWTIGYGHTGDVRPDQRLKSQKEAEELLRSDLKRYSEYVNTYTKNGLIKFPMSQDRFDALVSFTYNLGPGNLKKLVTNRNANQVADKMLEYCHAGKRELPGLKLRRQAEHDLFLGNHVSLKSCSDMTSEWSRLFDGKKFITDLGMTSHIEKDGHTISIARYAVWLPVDKGMGHQITEVGENLAQLLEKYGINGEDVCRLNQGTPADMEHLSSPDPFEAGNHDSSSDNREEAKACNYSI